MFKLSIAKATCASALIFAGITLTSCGEDPNAYSNEVLTFDNIQASDNVAAKTADEDNDTLTLKEQEASEFWRGAPRPLFGFQYPRFPFYDYYKRPLAVTTATSPIHSYVDYIHPFYIPAYFHNLYDESRRH